MKQTAVEWLADEIIELEEKLRQGIINYNDFFDAKDELVNEALKKEKEQNLKQWLSGFTQQKYPNYDTRICTLRVGG